MRTKRNAYRWLAVVAVASQLVLAVAPAASAGCGAAAETAAPAMMPADHHGGERAAVPQTDTCDCDCLTHLTCTMPIPALPNGADTDNPPPHDAERGPVRSRPTLAAHGRRLERPPA